MKYQALIDEAFKAMTNAYTPYSHYNVGASVLCKDGKTFKGCNIENASYGATNCGERTAIFAAYANGYRKDDIEAIAIVSDGYRIAAPCGICRQVLAELINYDTPIILSNGKETIETNIKELLPMHFDSSDVLEKLK